MLYSSSSARLEVAAPDSSGLSEAVVAYDVCVCVDFVFVHCA